jgi:hypothetical protein
MERLGQADLDVSRFADVEVIMVDESHNFRNAGTNRYNNLAKIVGSGDPKRVILLTATPISNTLWDLYHQLALFTRNNDGYFRDVGIPSLRRYFREAEAAGIGTGGQRDDAAATAHLPARTRTRDGGRTAGWHS